MSISHHHLTAALTPEGRLSPMAFFMLFVPLIAADFVLFRLISLVPVDERGLTMQSALMLLIIYMQYCLLSRRRQDTDKSGLPYLLFLVVGAACWYKLLDPAFLDPDLPETHRYALAAANMHHAARILAFVFFLRELVKPSIAGPNSYGQEFGESSDRVSRWRTESVMGVTQPVKPPRAPVIETKAPPVELEPQRRKPQLVTIPDQRASFGRLGRPATTAHNHGH